jgi:hypothetical protein
MDQVNQSPKGEKETKTLEKNDLDQFTQKEVKEFIKYNKDITKLNSTYSELTFRNRKVLVRVFTRDFGKNDGTLHYSKTEYLKIASGIDNSVIYDEFPNPYPFTRKAVVVSSNISDLQQGMIVSLNDKPTVVIQKQDQGFPLVAGGFIHPDYEDNYITPPQDPLDPNYGYVLTNEQNIELIF